jgi:hypothetical protein
MTEITMGVGIEVGVEVGTGVRVEVGTGVGVGVGTAVGVEVGTEVGVGAMVALAVARGIRLLPPLSPPHPAVRNTKAASNAGSHVWSILFLRV